MDIASTLPRPAATTAAPAALRERPALPPPGGGDGDLAAGLARRAAASRDDAVSFAEGIKIAVRQVGEQVDGMKRALHDSLIQALRAIGMSGREAEAWARDVVGKLSESKRDDFEEAGRQTALRMQSTEVAFSLKVENLSLTVEADGQKLSIDTTQVTLSLSVSSVAATIRGDRAMAPPPPPPRPPQDPLILDLDGNGVDLTTVDKGVFWDLTGNGTPEQIAWIKGGDALLALDRNGNGAIDSGLELFGDQHGAADGLAELAKFDANRDGAIDRADPVFDSLVLLRPDFSQASLGKAGVDRIRLDLTVPVGRRLAGGTLDAAAPVEQAGGGQVAAGSVRLDLRA